jgi:hypothetical protein
MDYIFFLAELAVLMGSFGVMFYFMEKSLSR